MDTDILNQLRERLRICHAYRENQERKEKYLHLDTPRQHLVDAPNQMTEEADLDHVLLGVDHRQISIVVARLPGNDGNPPLQFATPLLERSSARAELEDEDAMS